MPLPEIRPSIRISATLPFKEYGLTYEYAFFPGS